MGANTVRIYGWLMENDHSDFLDALEQHGLKLMATFYMGDATETPVKTQAQRDKVVQAFVDQVERHAKYRALLFWSFGNELNGVWNKYLQALGRTEVDPCGWDGGTTTSAAAGSTRGRLPPAPPATNQASASTRPLQLHQPGSEGSEAGGRWLRSLKRTSTRSTTRYCARSSSPSTRGQRRSTAGAFGAFFEAMANSTNKPVLLTEYGVDAYHDVSAPTQSRRRATTRSATRWVKTRARKRSLRGI